MSAELSLLSVMPSYNVKFLHSSFSVCKVVIKSDILNNFVRKLYLFLYTVKTLKRSDSCYAGIRYGVTELHKVTVSDTINIQSIDHLP